MDVQISTGTRSDPDPNHGHQDRAQPGPFKCNVCQRTYARIDHLSRHFRLHTSERPYRCEVCYKAFNRPDLLKRHALIHPENGRYDKSHASRPRRVSQACKACAAAKLRCKEKKPCQRCEKKSITCEYNDIDNRIAGHWRATPQLISGSSTVPQNITSTTSESDPTGYPRDEDVHVHDENNTEFLSSSGRIRDDLGVKASRDVINVAQARIEDDPSLLLPMDGSAGELIGGDENMFADFLREVMMPTPLEQFNSQPLPAYDTDAQNTAFIDIFSFGLESDLELNDEDYNVMSFYHGRDPADNAGPKDVADNPYSSNEQLGLQSNTITQNNSECIALGANAFRSSPWCWTPVHADTGLIEEHYLTLQPSEMVTTGTQFAHAAHVNTDNLDSVARDKVMAMVLNTTSRSSFEKVMSSFPPVDLLNNCVHSFLASHRAQPDTWIHMPTLRIGKQRAALLGSFISAGAILSTSPTIRKLGFAINEAVRLALPRVCEENNSVTRDLGLLQAMMLNLDVGLWSGNKRKMELAESHSGVLTTMCRRASRFLRSNYKVIIPHESDQDEILEEKWKSWAYQESMKRLIFALFTRDAQTSISFIVPTIISYAELSLPLPESRSLFLARTANEWKSMYFSQTSSGNRNERIPSLQQCLLDIGPLTNPSIRSRIDITLSLSIIAYGIWGLIQDYRQLNSVAKSYPPSRLTPGMLVLEHRHQELCQMLQLFSVSLSEAEPRRKEVSGTILQSKLLTELLLTHLHVSFDNLQLFAGREGEEEARRVYPALQQWAASHEARTALYHAGQVVRHAKLLNGNGGAQQGGLRDFFAVAVYHSALTFWAFGVLGLGPRLGQDLHRLDTPNQNGSGEYDDNHEDDIVWLDAEESPATRSFIALGRGIPCFSTVAAGSEITAKEITRISDPQNVMNAIVKILRRVPSDEDSDTPLPPPLLVENLSQLIKGLGDATKGL